MKCPFCQQELEVCGKYTDGTSKVWCSKCNLFGDSKLFEELITTRKALDVAIDAMKKSNEIVYSAYGSPLKTLKDALDQINEITKGNK